MIDRSIRDYEVSIWTLQDSFITVLKQYGIESKGQIQDGNFHMSDDGTLELSFTLPMYIYQGTNNPRYFNEELDEKVVGVLENPLWHNTVNGNLIANMRKVKLIFNKGSKEEGVFEFLITKVTERHEGKNERFCDVECEGLAFHELGKIGYQVSLSSDDYYNDYEEAIENNRELPINNINYWCDKLFPANSEWKYAIYMDYSGYDGIVCCQVIENGVSLIDVAHTDINRISDSEYITDEELIDYAEADDELRAQVDEWRTEHGYRLNNKIYEDAYVSSWEVNGDAVVAKTVETEKEKCRMMDESESNLYNLTQKIAETFGVFCRYEYEHDENYHIIGKKVVFYNNFLQEATGTIDLTYPYQLSSITRTMESPDLVTKMYVKSLSDSATESGECWIEDAEANKMRENYVMNFDYLHTIGTITDEQYAEIPKYEAKVRALNDQIIPLQKELEQLVVHLPEVEAKKTISENAISLDLERISANNDLLNAITNGTGIIPVNAESFYLIQDTSDTTTYKYTLTFRKIGIVESSIEVYENYNSSSHVLSNQISGFNIEKDEYNNVKKLTFTFISPLENSTKYYVKYSYSPELEYKNIRLQWENRLAQDTVENERASNEFDDLKNKIETLKGSIDNLLIEKKNIITTFERLMGPALREGNWQPDDDYAQFGDKYSDSIDGSTGLYYDVELFDDEEDGFYTESINEETVYYPYIPLGTDDLNILKNYYNDPHLTLVMEDTTLPISDENRTQYYPVNSRLFFGYVAEKRTATVPENQSPTNNYDSETDTSPEVEFDIPEGYESNTYVLDIIYEIKNYTGSAGTKIPQIYAVCHINKNDESKYGTIRPIIGNSSEYVNSNGIFTYHKVFNFNSTINSNAEGQKTYINEYHKQAIKMRMRNANANAQVIIHKVSVRRYDNDKLTKNLCQAAGTITPALILTNCNDINVDGISGETLTDKIRNKLNNNYVYKLRLVDYSVDNNEVTRIETPLTIVDNNDETQTLNVGSFESFSPTKMRAYPRIEIPSLKLKLSEDELIINSDDERLYEFKDYYIMPRDESYYITLTPTRAMFSTYPLQVDYTISNTSLAIYLDALEVLKENAYPKVSYETDVSVVNPAFMHTAYKCLDKIANINDNDLRLYNVQGYISEMELNLDKPQEDSLTIKNYKTKFEDLFSSIVASTEAMQKNSNIIGLASSMLTSQGIIVPSVIKNSIMRADLDYSFNNGKLTISEGDGIWATSDDGVVAYRGGGIFTATEKDANGNWIWNTGILPQGINANLITTGQLDTNLIRIYAGDNLRLQMNGDGLFAYKEYEGTNNENVDPDTVDPKQYVVHNSEGLFLVAKAGAKIIDSNNAEHIIQSDVERVSISWDGLKLRNYSNQEVFYASADTGDLNITGYITAKGLTIKSGNDDADVDQYIFNSTQSVGRNMLLETGNEVTITITNPSINTYTNYFEQSNWGKNNTVGNTTDLITISYDWESTSETGYAWPQIEGNTMSNIQIVNGQSSKYSYAISLGDGSGHYRCTFKLTDTQAQKAQQRVRIRVAAEDAQVNRPGPTLNSTFTIRNLKFEMGDKETSWTPAPEDAQNAANQAQLTADNIHNGTTGISFDITSGLTTIGKVDLNTDVGLLITNKVSGVDKYMFQADGLKMGFFSYENNAWNPNLLYSNGNLWLSGSVFTNGTLGGIINSNDNTVNDTYAWKVDGADLYVVKNANNNTTYRPICFSAGGADAYPSIILKKDSSNEVLKFDNNGLQITGKVTATSGQIGPWTIGSDSIYYDLGTDNPNTNGSSIGIANSMYFGKSGLSISDIFKIERINDIADANNGAFKSFKLYSASGSNDEDILLSLDRPDADSNFSLYINDNIFPIQNAPKRYGGTGNIYYALSENELKQYNNITNGSIGIVAIKNLDTGTNGNNTTINIDEKTMGIAKSSTQMNVKYDNNYPSLNKNYYWNVYGQTYNGNVNRCRIGAYSNSMSARCAGIFSFTTEAKISENSEFTVAFNYVNRITDEWHIPSNGATITYQKAKVYIALYSEDDISEPIATAVFFKSGTTWNDTKQSESIQLNKIKNTSILSGKNCYLIFYSDEKDSLLFINNNDGEIQLTYTNPQSGTTYTYANDLYVYNDSWYKLNSTWTEVL